jgi:hypothetical protein
MLPLFAIILTDTVFYMKKVIKRYSMFTIGVLFLVSFTLIIFLSSIRSTYFSDINDFIDHMSIFAFERTDFDISAFGGNLFDDTKYVYDHYGRSQEFLYGHSLYTILVNPIPRSLWQNKPIGFGKLYAESRGYPRSNPTSLAAGIAGEGYANFGILGIAIFAIIFGSLCGAAAKVSFICFAYGGILHIPMGFFAFNISRSFVRGDMLSAFGSSVYPFFLYIILIVIPISMLSRKQKYQRTIQ